MGSDIMKFTWYGKENAIIESMTPSTGTLRPDKESSKNWDDTENLYIEGDNLEVLKLLQKSYFGKVKMIYIDPPYNTGKDFIYKDNFRDNIANYKEITNQTTKANPETNGRYHTDWLNMMYPRLKLAKNLLTDDGIIFISIDDNEMNNLRKICDEIFGEDNFIEQIIWKNKYGAGAKTKGFISVHEYILCYSKSNINNLTSDLSEEERKKYIKKDEKYEKYGGYRTQPLMTKSLGDRPNLVYPIIYKGNEIWPNKQWVWSKERMENALKNNDVEIRERNDGTYSVEAKKYLKDEYGNSRRGKPSSILNGPFTQEGTLEIKQLFNDKTPFEFTKPSNLIKYLISLEINDNNDKDFIILDFFSGSATTAHSVLKLNSEDKGKRKFIMVQVPEKTSEKSQAFNLGYSNICEIGKERIRKVGDKIVSENKDKEGIENLDIGFKVFKLEYNCGGENYSMMEEGIKVDIIKRPKDKPICKFKVDSELYYLVKTNKDIIVFPYKSSMKGKAIASIFNIELCKDKDYMQLEYLYNIKLNEFNGEDFAHSQYVTSVILDNVYKNLND